MGKSELTQARLREVLDYDSETGEFRWRVRLSLRRSAGAMAGTKHRIGYVSIGIGGVKHYAHRLAWLWVHGSWPAQHIDHINGDPGDNRIANLRDVDRHTNLQNMRKPPSTSRTGIIGAAIHPKGGFQPGIRVNGKRQALGRFYTAEEAHAVYVEAKRRLHPGCTL